MLRMFSRAVVRWAPLVLLLASSATPLAGQHGTKNGEWRAYAGEPGRTKYSPLDQINKDNAKTLRIAWRFKTDNLGAFPDYNMEVTPVMVNGVLYTQAGSRRDVVALDSTTGEIFIPKTGRPGRLGTMLTKTLLWAGERGPLVTVNGQQGSWFRSYDKATGAIVSETLLPANTTGVPMTYMANGKQYIVVAVAAPGHPAELAALTLP